MTCLKDEGTLLAPRILTFYQSEHHHMRFEIDDSELQFNENRLRKTILYYHQQHRIPETQATATKSVTTTTAIYKPRGKEVIT